ncbi:hypothetical protein N9Y60_00800 [Crocinitomicaceae bacterium]|nr:hypothetical protein [Crocinitomicaceae bacterium]MDC0257542.1 hypothetical protein [Crocinitomicaceae bacterium]
MEEKKDIFDFIEKRPIETPDSSYFKDLADKVIADASTSSTGTGQVTDQSKAKIIPLYRRPAAWISAVAAAVLVAFLMLPESSDPVIIDGGAASVEPSRAEVLAYVNENIDDFDEELLVEFIAIKNLASKSASSQESEPEEEALETMIETETEDLQESLKNISDEEILEYLELEGELDEEDEFILL